MTTAPRRILSPIIALLALLFSAAISWAEEEMPVCHPDQNPAFALQKSIAVLNIAIDDQEAVRDMPELGKAVAQYLQHSLRQGQTMRVRDGSQHYFAQQRINLLGQVETGLHNQLIKLSQELNSQLIISGRITDLNIKSRKGGVGGVLNYLNPSQGDTRVFAIELTVHDGYSGATILQKHYQTQASGTVNMQGMMPMKGRFLETDYGMAVSTLLNGAAKALQDELSCIPMMTRISRISEDGIHIEDGSEAMLRPGDRLRLFHRRPNGVDKMGNELFIEEFVGDAHTIRVFPDSALLEMSGGQPNSLLRPGDVARAW